MKPLTPNTGWRRDERSQRDKHGTDDVAPFGERRLVTFTHPHAEGGATPEEVGEVVDHSAADMLPAELLQPGEIIILLLKPSVWYVVLGSLRELAIIGVLLTLGLWLGAAGHLNLSDRDLILFAIGLVAVRLFWQFLEWLSRVYVLTDRRVIRVKGVLRISVFEAPLRQVQHTSARYSIRERVFGLGTIGFATAGTGLIEAAWVMIARPLEVHRTVVEALNRYRH